MFDHALFCKGKIDTWSVHMSFMFQNASTFNQPLNNWNINNVNQINGMFYSAKRFNQPLDQWQFSRDCMNIEAMFIDALLCWILSA